MSLSGLPFRYVALAIDNEKEEDHFWKVRVPNAIPHMIWTRQSYLDPNSMVKVSEP